MKTARLGLCLARQCNVALRQRIAGDYNTTRTRRKHDDMSSALLFESQRLALLEGSICVFVSISTFICRLSQLHAH